MAPKPPAPESAQFENTLERLFKEAADNEAARPYFYKELLESTVSVCPHEPLFQSEKDENSYTLKLGTILHEGINYVPFYTAPKRIPAGQRIADAPRQGVL